jgi:hypothetical protein
VFHRTEAFMSDSVDTQPGGDARDLLPDDAPVQQPDPAMRRNIADLDIEEGRERMQGDPSLRQPQNPSDR